MAKLAVISNPNSQRNRQGGLDGVTAVADAHPNVVQARLDDFSALGRTIERFCDEGVEIIAVNGGDGTVQAVLTELARRPLDQRPVKLAVLPGGMTNVIAKDVGLDGQPPTALARLIAAVDAADRTREVTRPLIGLALSPDRPPIYGMFFGAAGFYQAVKLANDKVRKKGVAGSLASASTLALSLFRLLFGRSGADDPLYRGEPMALEVDGREQAAGPRLILIATTLDRLILGLMPFWNRSGQGGTIRYTSIDFPPRHLMFALVPVLRGRPRRWMAEEGYRSGEAGNLVIRIESPVVLDGEIFQPDPAHPIRLTGDRFQTFVRC